MGSGLPAHVEEADLISYGLGGLISAIERFDLSREIRQEPLAKFDSCQRLRAPLFPSGLGFGKDAV